jgi:hypothetical protein
MLSAGRHPATWRPATTLTVLVAAVLLVAAAATWATRSHSTSLGVTVSSPHILGYLHAYAPTAPQVERAFADHHVPLQRDDAAALQPRFAPIRRYTVATWRTAGAPHTLIVLLSRQPDRAVERLSAEFPPPGVVGSESSGRLWVEYGRLRAGLATRMRAAFGELRHIAPPA